MIRKSNLRISVYSIIVVRIVNNGLGFIFFPFAFSFFVSLFYFLISVYFTFLFVILDLNKGCSVTLHMTVTQSCDTEKDIEGSGTDNII